MSPDERSASSVAAELETELQVDEDRLADADRAASTGRKAWKAPGGSVLVRLSAEERVGLETLAAAMGRVVARKRAKAGLPALDDAELVTVAKAAAYALRRGLAVALSDIGRRR
jgi:hypothetical protein